MEPVPSLMCWFLLALFFETLGPVLLVLWTFSVVPGLVFWGCPVLGFDRGPGNLADAFCLSGKYGLVVFTYLFPAVADKRESGAIMYHYDRIRFARFAQGPATTPFIFSPPFFSCLFVPRSP